MTTVAELFESYRKHVIPPAASDVQVNESRRAFFAGVHVTLRVLLDHVGGADVPEADGIALLESFEAECRAFGEAGGRVTPSPPDIHYTVADPLEMEKTLKDIGGRIADGLPAGWGFLLMLFEYGAGGSLFYLSSADRADMLTAIAEFMKRQTQ